MPQSSPEMRLLMYKWFGDEVDDTGPMNFLVSRGYELTSRWLWKPPVPSHTVSAEEWKCMVFLIEEWDFGGLTRDWIGVSA